ncbi:phage portal protein [Brevibacillus ruminantium]|uniref:Phage portal protein n=1 Tax=Brevibacillus ruminantium TaxID=2950604 RepID=A0ABY4WAA8_9BACL|nr:phage portal protein [Brevibacillus ruminantium]USG63993.1 phage portal protein [Brevibacillus ruminantium]
MSDLAAESAGSRAQWIPIGKAEEAPASQQLPADKFKGDYEQHGLIVPEVTPAALFAVVKQSSIIPQCIEAYKTNVTGYGCALEYMPNESDKTAKAEWDIAERFLQTANLEKSIEQLLAELVDDLESCGDAYIEVARGGGLPALYRIPPQNMRCTAEQTKVTMKYKRLVQGKVEEFTQEKWVRRYAQKRGNNIVWFREFGSPGTENEVIHLKLGNGVYGEPRWAGNTPGILGSRRAEELNLNYFEDGRMLSMLLSVINGQLTPQSIEAIRNARGQKSQGGILYLEVEGFEKGLTGDEKEKTEVKLDKLNDLLQQDALFSEYNKDKRIEIRSAFRLPPILTGESEDYNRATSDNARRIAEEQVFIPYRVWLMNEIFNKRLFPSIGVYRVKAVLRGPKISDPDERKAMLDYLADRGILVVRDLIPIAEEVLGTVLDEARFPAGYLDTPIAQLTSSFTPFATEEDPEEQLATIAKRLLRETREKHHV